MEVDEPPTAGSAVVAATTGTTPGSSDPSERAGFCRPEDEVCPHCKANRYTRKDLRLFTSLCGHFLCGECLDNLFQRATIRCPTCREERRRNDYELKVFDSGHVQRDVAIRRRQLQRLNLTEKDFPTLAAYNDYLEQREDIAYNLSNDLDLVETGQRLDKLLNDYAEQIATNEARADRLRRERLQRQKLEQDAALARRRLAEQRAIQAEQRRTKERTMIMGLLERGVELKQARLQVKTELDQEERALADEAARLRQQQEADAHMETLVPREAAPLFVYQRPTRKLANGLITPPTPEIAQAFYASGATWQQALNGNVAETLLRVGGYLPEWTLKRGLQEALDGLTLD
ncbi:uncharacterized protein MONBRDRAFT_6728 [Monosiga brevicollis MX1]|uniref:RING-type domain-containing protein n=1 Tax=Monosiga brevicollis TaxID=81824 RepID=A9UV49_MONBE|nr:uncharacterized protein MONBRDRAFT_6728 [Monosiga brevicollis MX1]EDQ90833.1 predicted protein [Monosiga brevicollis MX1]|eukprot:XP_001744130.1 hypothetical protein [Monosiga brevicollis MX1]